MRVHGTRVTTVQDQTATNRSKPTICKQRSNSALSTRLRTLTSPQELTQGSAQRSKRNRARRTSQFEGNTRPTSESTSRRRPRSSRRRDRQPTARGGEVDGNYRSCTMDVQPSSLMHLTGRQLKRHFTIWRHWPRTTTGFRATLRNPQPQPTAACPSKPGAPAFPVKHETRTRPNLLIQGVLTHGGKSKGAPLQWKSAPGELVDPKRQNPGTERP